MSLRPTFINALKAAILADFLALYQKPCIISEAELTRFVVRKGFDSLHEAQAYFKRVLNYFSQKYTFVPTFRHLISEKLPTFRDMADWERAVYRKWPSFQPVLFIPTKSALDMNYQVAEELLSNAETIQFAVNFAQDMMYCPDLRYIPQAVILLERAIFSLAYRQANAPAAANFLITAHARIVALRDPKRDTNPGWLKQHFAYAVLRRLLYRIDANTVDYVWNALKICIQRGEIPDTWVSFAASMRKYIQYVCPENPLILTRMEYEQAYSVCPEVMVYYPYQVA